MQWNVQVVDSGGYTGLYNSIAVDGQGLPHIAYREVIPEERLRYAHWDGTKWALSTVDEGPSAGQRASIAVDSKGRPHISYRLLKDQVTDQVRYARWNGSAWQIFIVESFPGVSIQTTSIVLDGNDLPHIAYIHIGQVFRRIDPLPLFVDKVKYARPTGPSTWQINQLESREHVPGAVFSISLSLDSQGRPHLAYPLYVFPLSAQAPYKIDLRYSRVENGIWRRSTIESYDWDIPSTSIAMTLDHNGTAIVVYRTGNSIRQGTLVGFQVNGTSAKSTWETVNIDRVAPPTVDVNVAMDSSGRVHVFYSDFAQKSFVLKYAVRLEHHWQKRTVDSIVAGNQNAIVVALDASLAVMPGGTPQVSYYDPVGVDLKYATAA